MKTHSAIASPGGAAGPAAGGGFPSSPSAVVSSYRKRMNRIGGLRYRARMLHLAGASYGQIAARLSVSRTEAWRLVNRVPKAGPLPLKGMVRRAA